MSLRANRWPSVIGLLPLGGPAAVAGLVVAVYVNAIDGVAERRPSTEVCQEVFVAVGPSVAHANPSAAVVLAPDVSATTLHRHPRPVRRAPVVAVLADRVALSGDFGLKAAATANDATAKPRSSHDLSAAALAAAKVGGLPVNHPIEANYGQSVDLSASGDFLELSLLRHV